MKKRNFISIIIGFLLVFVLYFWLNNFRKIKDLPDILKEGRISVLIESGVYGFTRDSTRVYGFQYELIKMFSDSLGVELVVINEEATKDGIRELKNGDCNVLVSLRPVNMDTLGQVISLRPILSTKLMLAQHKDRSNEKFVRKQYELDGDTITIIKNSPYKDKLKILADDLAINLHIQEVAVKNYDDMMRLVNDQKISYSVCPEYLTKRLKANCSDVDFDLPLSFEFDLSWSVNKQSKLLREKLNNFLEDFIDSPYYQVLLKKYFL